MRADRLLAELNLLQARGRMTAVELALELEVTERTIYRDMYALQVAGVPLVAERGRAGGYSLYGDWRTDLTGLTAGELESLLTASAFSPDTRAGSTGLSAAVKLAAMLPVSQADELNRLRRRIHVEPGNQGIWNTLVTAVRTGHAVTLTLQRLQARRITRLAHPIGLVVADRDWHLVWHGGDRIPRLDDRRAIHHASVATETLVDAGSVDLAHVWQQWAEHRRLTAQRYHARLRMDPDVVERWRRRYPVLDESPAADAVEVITAFGSIHGARAAVLAWGSAVEVIAPRALRLTVADFAGQTAALYGGEGRAKPVSGAGS